MLLSFMLSMLMMKCNKQMNSCKSHAPVSLPYRLLKQNGFVLAFDVYNVALGGQQHHFQ